MIVFFAFLSYGQTISFRDDTAESLTIGTNYSIIGRQLGISLEYGLNKSTKEELWALGFILYSRNERISIDQGAKLIIRTYNGTILELKQNQNCHEIKRDSDYPYKSAYDVKDYMVYPNYFISGNDLQSLIKEGIQKMRFETTKGIKDLQWDKDIYGELIKSEYNLILGKSDFGADF